MKKIVVAMTLALVLAFSAVSFAATTMTLGGRVLLDVYSMGDGSGIKASSQFRLNGVWTVNDLTNARIYWRSTDNNGIPSKLYYAEVNTKLAGGTARFGQVEYGFSPLVNPNSPGSNLGAFDGGLGVAFLSPTVSGTTVNAFVGPNGGTTANSRLNLGAEAKMNVGAGSVGVALAKKGDFDSQWSIFGSYPVVKDTMIVYGEYGKGVDAGGVQLADAYQNLGIKGTVSGLSYVVEDDLTSKKGYAEIAKPMNGVTYKAGYHFGDGLAAADRGKIQLEARVDF